MAIQILLPRLGWTMEEGVFVEWLKRDGDLVQPGDLLFTIESDKATTEVESFDTGILRLPPDGPKAGATLPVGAVLAYLVQPGERAPFEQAGDSQPTTDDSQPTTDNRQPTTDHRRQPADDRPPTTDDRPPTTDNRPPTTDNRPPTTDHRRQPADDRPPTTDDQRPATPISHLSASIPPSARHSPAISPRARRVAAELGISWAALSGSGRTGRIVERDIRAAAAQASASPVRATPLARKLAAELGVDLAQLADGQPGRRIERAEVEQAAGAPAPAPASPPASEGAPLSGVRRIIAARMAEGAHTAAPVTLTTEADATELARLRARIGEDLAGSELLTPTYTDLLAKLVALALAEHPALNASLVGDRIVQHPAAHIGLAVDTERGLLVPVVRDAQARSVQQIAAESARLIGLARAGKAAPDELRGSTFTITNLGMYEIDAFTPIINLPECAILGVGRIVARPVVVDEQAETVAVRKMLALSLTFDHRIVDGAPAARFLQRVKHLVEHPYAWLTR